MLLIQSRPLQLLVRYYFVRYAAGLTYKGTVTTDTAGFLRPCLWVHEIIICITGPSTFAPNAPKDDG